MRDTRHVKGLDRLDEALRRLPSDIARKWLRGALRAGGAVLADEARTNVRRKSGDLAKTIRVSADGKFSGGSMKAFVRAGNKKVWWAHFIEWGTQAHEIAAKKKDGALKLFTNFFAEKVDHPGAKPFPFMRPAFDRKAIAAVNAFAEYLRKRIGSKRSGLDKGTRKGIMSMDLGVDE